MDAELVASYALQGFCALVASAGVLYVTYIIKSMSLTDDKQQSLESQLANQSYVLDEKKNVRTSQFVKNRPLVDTMMGDLTTLHEVFQRGLRVACDSPCLGWRPTADAPYEWITYAQTYKLVSRLGSGLLTLEPSKIGDIFFVGIYAVNCVEWAITQQACSTFSFVIVPLYDTLGESARKYIIEQTQFSVCICDTVARVRNLISDLDTNNNIQHIIVIRPQDQLEMLRSEAGNRVRIHTFDDIMAKGRENAISKRLPKPDDLHLLCYTSGTTGRAKGVMITHRMIVSVIAGFDLDLQDVNIIPGDFYLSFLPLAHVFEQIVMHYCFGRGAAVGFYAGDLRKLSDDILALRPTLFVAVPRVLQRLHATVQAAVESSKFKTWLLKVAVAAKMCYVRRGIVTRDTFWDKRILKPIQDRMGGRLRFFACGSAPISEEVYQFCRAALGVHAYEAYGLTETCGAMMMTLPFDYKCGHTGPPLPCCMVKLVDVPDMNVSVARDGIGEICVKGPSCTKGYYQDEERTRELIDPEGWLHTGDIGQWTQRGCLQLVDRCKNMFKLAQGEYVSPEKVELIYNNSKFVNQVYVDGKSQESFAIAIVVPEIDYLKKALESGIGSNGISTRTAKKSPELTPDELCQSKTARLTVLADLIRLGKEADLKGFEQAKSIYLTPIEFTIDAGLLTPTQKKCRAAFRHAFKTQIDRLYHEEMLV